MKQFLFLVILMMSIKAATAQVEGGKFISEVPSCTINKYKVSVGDTLYYKDSSKILVIKLKKYLRNNIDIYVAYVKHRNSKLTYNLNKAIEWGQIIAPGGILQEGKYFSRYPFISKNTLYVNDSIRIAEGDFIELSGGSLPNGDYKWVSVERGKGNYFSGRRCQVDNIRASGDDDIGYKYFVFLLGDHKKYTCDAESAYLAGEISINGKRKAVNTFPTLSVADEIKKLKELKDQGVLTEEEFQDQKKKLLNR